MMVACLFPAESFTLLCLSLASFTGPSSLLKAEPSRSFGQESPRQTKPKKGQFMNLSRGHSGKKVRCVNRYFARSPENFVDFFFELAWVFCIEKWRGFLVNFFWSSVSHETKHENSSKISGKIRSKIRETFVLQLF